MTISGYQRLSMIDYPGLCSSIIFTQGCPFRCSFCHNPDLVSGRTPSSLEIDSVMEDIEKHRSMLGGVVVTGGEPTIHQGLGALLRRIKDLGLRVKLDTNGVHPDHVQQLISDGLIDYLAMDVKHRWEEYGKVTQVTSERMVDRCKETLSLIQRSGIDHEFRTTIMPDVHTMEDFIEMAGYLLPNERYAVQETRFTKTLDPNISHVMNIHANEVVDTLRLQFPTLELISR